MIAEPKLCFDPAPNCELANSKNTSHELTHGENAGSPLTDGKSPQRELAYRNQDPGRDLAQGKDTKGGLANRQYAEGDSAYGDDAPGNPDLSCLGISPGHNVHQGQPRHRVTRGKLPIHAAILIGVTLPCSKTRLDNLVIDLGV